VTPDTSSATRRARNPRGQGERLRTALIDAAIELLAELDDVDALSVRAVTARAGVTPTALYLHFADKEELVIAVKERCFAELRRYVLDAEARPADGPRAQLHAMGLAYLAFANERRGYYRAIFHTRLGGAPSPTSADPGGDGAPVVPGPPGGAAAFGDLVRGVKRCLPETGDAFATATMLWAGLHGYAGLQTMPRFPFPPPETYVKRLIEAHLGR
jgi:AcrR family transcriptional regulator